MCECLCNHFCYFFYFCIITICSFDYVGMRGPLPFMLSNISNTLTPYMKENWMAHSSLPIIPSFIYLFIYCLTSLVRSAQMQRYSYNTRVFIMHKVRFKPTPQQNMNITYYTKDLCKYINHKVI